MRSLRPGLFVFCLALIASLCVHLPVYEVLGVLADTLLREAGPAPSTPVEFEVAELGETVTQAEPEPEDLPARPDEVEPEAAPPPAEKPPEAAPPEPVPTPAPTPTPAIPVEVPAQAVPPPPEPDPAEKLAVTQKSDDPEVPPPEDARFVAEQNRRVEEETIASLRNLQRDDEPEAGPARNAPEPELGNADEHDSADLADVKGSDERAATEQEAADRPVEAASESAGQRNAVAAAPAPQAGAAPPASRAQTPQVAAGSERTGGEDESILVEDESGSFRIRRVPPGAGAGAEGGATRPGASTPDHGSRQGARARNGVNLNVTWSQFEQTFGAEELSRQREAYLEQRRSTARGGSRDRNWRKFRAAIENYVPDVRIGNQTALNAAASPFAAFLAAVHRRIHREYAEGFLRNLPMAGGPFSDPTLFTDLEIVWNRDGSLHKVGILRSSGFLPFDYGAFDAVMRGAPYPPPPEQILSGNGKAYIHWGFYRNERQCGTFNARPKIIPNPPGSPRPGGGPFDDRDGTHGVQPGPAAPPGAAEHAVLP